MLGKYIELIRCVLFLAFWQNIVIWFRKLHIEILNEISLSTLLSKIPQYKNACLQLVLRQKSHESAFHTYLHNKVLLCSDTQYSSAASAGDLPKKNFQNRSGKNGFEPINRDRQTQQNFIRVTHTYMQ